MILVDWQIREKMEKGDLIIDPIKMSEQIGPASVDLRLDCHKVIFKKREGYYKNNSGENVYYPIEEKIEDERDTDVWASKDSLFIFPKEFALFNTIEKIGLGNNIVGQLEGRSSIGRQGLFIHNAGFIDPGFSGQITLEFFNATDSILTLPIGIRICQLVLFECATPDVPYNKRKSSKYLNQSGITLSKLSNELK